MKKKDIQKTSGTLPLRKIPTTALHESKELQEVISIMEKLVHWAAIVDSSDDAIISKSSEGYITSWNKGAERLYGYKAEEIIGKPVSVLMPPEREDDFPMIMKQLHDGKRIEHYETKRKTKDGRVIDVSITVSPIRDSLGNIIGASKIARDITERVELEQRRDEFITTVAHELKTPLTSQKIFGEILEQLIQKNNETEYLPYIQKLNLQTEKLRKLIDDLLQLSRMSDGRLTLEKKKFSFDELITETIDTTKLTTKHTIVLEGKTGKKILGDKYRLGQVITNLLSNAIKYSPKADKVVVSIFTKEKNVVIGVQDFGIGIDPTYFDKIFERFFRVNGVDEKTFPGMGIGLHFCKQIVLRHGGEIWVESTGKKGSTFFVSLPFI